MTFDPQAPARLLAKLRAEPPLVHNITNWVAMDLSANLLLALGASPAMVHAQSEVEEFVNLAGALVVNIGTFDETWTKPAITAATLAANKQIPWVLDPVAAGVTTFRTRNARNLIACKPDCIRANASEILAIAPRAHTSDTSDTSHNSHNSERARGVDSLAAAHEALPAAIRLALHSGAVVLLTGAEDFVTNGKEHFRLRGGHPLLARITASGCALSATTAAFFAAARHQSQDTDNDPRLVPALSAALLFAAAAERAAEHAKGPGSFRATFLDAISDIADSANSADSSVGDEDHPLTIMSRTRVESVHS
ncbi:MAG: hydroxyethylthiazole kinase [Alphaproteobacteria bacterium]